MFGFSPKTNINYWIFVKFPNILEILANIFQKPIIDIGLTTNQLLYWQKQNQYNTIIFKESALTIIPN